MSGPTGATRRPPLVVGLGNPERGDDAVGMAVARSVAALLPGIAVTCCEDPTSLLDLWSEHGPVVVVDAVRSGALPGTVHRLELGPGEPPPAARSWTDGARGTHALGLGEIVALARALGRLPDRLVVVGVEGERFDHGLPLSAAVAASVPAAVEGVVRALES